MKGVKGLVLHPLGMLLKRDDLDNVVLYRASMTGTTPMLLSINEEVGTCMIFICLELSAFL